MGSKSKGRRLCCRSCSPSGFAFADSLAGSGATTVTASGAGFGLTPFGRERNRLTRLSHAIVGKQRFIGQLRVLQLRLLPPISSRTCHPVRRFEHRSLLLRIAQGVGSLQCGQRLFLLAPLRRHFVVAVQVLLQDSGRIVNGLLQVVDLLNGRCLRRALLFTCRYRILWRRIRTKDISQNDDQEKADDGKEDLALGGVADSGCLNRFRVRNAWRTYVIGVRRHRTSPVSPA